MTDYLEEQLDNAGALLEKVKKMEGGMPAPALEEEPFSEDQAEKSAAETGRDVVSAGEEKVDNLKKEIDQTKRMVNILGSEGEIQRKETEKAVKRLEKTVYDGNFAEISEAETSAGEESRSERGRANERRAEKNSSPLAERLEELDRAVTGLSAETSQREENIRLRPGTGRGGERRTLLSEGSRGTAVPFDGEGRTGGGGGLDGLQNLSMLIWAEQADRVFRRDSRRYDGSFYLY